jgi:glucosamine--fructose-6-phosphate aminotransferase (isomerizing)
VVGSSIPRETHAGVYTHAGPEIGVASTKHLSPGNSINLMALKLARKKIKLSQEHIFSID